MKTIINYLLEKTFKRAPSSSTIGTALICAGKEKEINQYKSKKVEYDDLVDIHMKLLTYFMDIYEIISAKFGVNEGKGIHTLYT